MPILKSSVFGNHHFRGMMICNSTVFVKIFKVFRFSGLGSSFEKYFMHILIIHKQL